MNLMNLKKEPGTVKRTAVVKIIFSLIEGYTFMGNVKILESIGGYGGLK
jgi:hypothetical protein